MGTGRLCVINLTCFYVAQNPGTPGDSQSTQGLCTMGNGWGMPLRAWLGALALDVFQLYLISLLLKKKLPARSWQNEPIPYAQQHEESPFGLPTTFQESPRA